MENMSDNRPSIAILGGTGNLGYALAWRWARVGYPVFIGSRTDEKAKTAALKLNARVGAETVHGGTHAQAVSASDIVVLTVPYAAHESTLEAIRPHMSGQILIDTTVPLRPPKVTVVQVPEEGPVAVQTQQYLGNQARVVAAFHNVAANLLDKDTEIQCDVLVTSDDQEARKLVMQLAVAAGCHALDAGALANSIVMESLTSILIHMNKIYKTGHAGIRITGLHGGQ